MIPRPTVALLSIQAVQTDLNLEKDQAKKISEISTEMVRERDRLMAEYNGRLGELNKKSADAATGLLSDAQLRRLEQLRLQQPGVRAFSTNAVAEKLGLTKPQRDEIAKLIQPRSTFERGRDRDRTTNPPNPNFPDAQRFQQLIEQANKRAANTREKVLALLTPEQKTKWFEMTGESFEFPVPQLPASRGSSTRSIEPAKPGVEKTNR